MTKLNQTSSGRLRSQAQPAPGLGLSILMLFVFLSIVFGCAAAGGAITAANVNDWYAGIIKPDLTPAPWVFPIVWNFLFFLMGLSAWIVWRAAGSLDRAGAAMSLFVAQLMLNFAWSAVFFGLHNLGLAVIENLALDGVIFATVWAFWRHSPLGAILLVPYLLWSLFATWLTTAIWLLN